MHSQNSLHLVELKLRPTLIPISLSPAPAAAPRSALRLYEFDYSRDPVEVESYSIV